MKAGPLKERLQHGETVIGTFVRTADPAVPEVLALSGFDFIILDGEHSPLEIRTFASLIRAADGMNLPVLTRVSHNDPFPIMQALDAGASGVMAPQVNSVDEARQLVSAAKYHPAGKRGFAANHRAARYGFTSPLAYADEANKNTLVVAYVETKRAVDALGETTAIEGIDVLFAGPFDLSQSYGVPGQVENVQVQQSLDRVAQACASQGKAAGTIASSVDQTRSLTAKGFQFIVFSSDLGILGQAAKSTLDEIREPYGVTGDGAGGGQP